MTSLFLSSLLCTAGNLAFAQWTQTNGPYGGSVYSFAVSSTILFAGTYTGGVFRSTNNGASWAPVNSGLTNNTVRALAVNGTNLFAGTSGDGVFLSTNNGTSWTAVNSGLTNTIVYAFAVSGTNLFAGTASGGVFLSTNNGSSWAAVNSGLTTNTIRALTVSGTNLFAGTPAGVFLSTNNGASWAPVNSGLPGVSVYAFVANGTNLFAGTLGYGVYLSTNNGSSWTAVNSGMTSTEVYALAVSGTNLFAGTSGGGVCLSTNLGASWTAVNSGLTNNVVRTLAVNGTNLLAGTDGGGVCLTTNNGASWSPVNSGMTNSIVRALAVSGTSLLAGTDGGVFLSTNDGAGWTAVSAGLTNSYVSAFAVSGTDVFVATAGGGVCRSTNNGVSWMAVNSGLTSSFVLALAVNSTNLFAGTFGDGVYLSTNNGTSWTPVNAGLTSGYVSAFAISGTSLLAGTNGGGVFLSTNNGASWTAVNSGLTSNYVQALASDGKNLYAGTIDGVCLSTNNGASWVAVNSGLTNTFVLALAVNGTNLFAGTAGDGVFLSTNTGASWTAVNAGLTRSEVCALAVSGTNLFAGTNDAGAWRRPLSEMISVPSPGVVTTTPSDITTMEATLNGMVNPNGTATTYYFEYGLTTSYGSTTTTQSAGSGSTAVPVRAALTTLIPDKTYHYRLVASNVWSTVQGMDQVFATLRTYPSSYALTTSTQFASRSSLTDYTSPEYRLIGIPGGSSELISAFLPGSHTSQWQVYWDNGKPNTETYYVEFDGTSTFSCVAGRAFWLLNLGPWSLSNRTVPTASLTTSREAIIQLTAGQKWNLITNPFDKPIAWAAVASRNGITDSIRGWSGSGWVRANTLEPYQGYLFFNSADKASLLIPFDATVPKVVTGGSASDWIVDIVVRCGEYRDETTSFGVVAGARQGMDSFEQRKPRRFDMIPDVYFNRMAWDTVYNEFATDIRPEVGDMQEWDMVLRSDDVTEVAIAFSGLDRIPSSLAVALVDDQARRHVDLRVRPAYVLKPTQRTTPLRVIVGNPDAVSEKLKGIEPREFVLYANYPNPFNPTTVIPLDIPQQSHIMLEIYSILGQRIRTLYDGELASGHYTFEWNGRNEAGQYASSGVYLYRMATQFSPLSVRKMVLAR